MTLFDLKIYFLLFIIYSFAGWIIDTSDIFIEEKKLVKMYYSIEGVKVLTNEELSQRFGLEMETIHANVNKTLNKEKILIYFF